MSNLNEPEPTQEPTAPTTVRWVNIYESDSATVSVLLRNEHVTRLLVETQQTLPLSFAVGALNRWNTDPRRHCHEPDAPLRARAGL